MNKKDYISAHLMKDIFSEPSEMYFQKLEERILNQTVYKADLKEKLLFILQNKPKGYETFVVDSAYFEGLESNLIGLTSGNFVTQPAWLDIKKDSPFIVLDTYFDDLALKINNKISKNKKRELSKLWMPNMLLQPQYMVAAIFCLALGIGFLAMYFKEDQLDAIASISKLSREDISNYMASNSHEIEIDYFAESESIVDLQKVKLNETDVNDILFDDEL
jgi:hypothetical protein